MLSSNSLRILPFYSSMRLRTFSSAQAADSLLAGPGINFQQSILGRQSFSIAYSLLLRGGSKSVCVDLSLASPHLTRANSSSSRQRKDFSSAGFPKLTISDSSPYLKQSSSSSPHSAMRMDREYSLLATCRCSAITDSKNLCLRWKGREPSSLGSVGTGPVGFCSFSSKLALREVLSLPSSPDSLKFSQSFWRKRMESVTWDI